MSRFGVLRSLFGVANKQHYPAESLRGLAHGTLFSDSESTFFKRLGESLANPENREGVLSIFGAYDTEPFPLTELLQTSIRFADIKKDAAGKLSDKEIDFINVSIAFLEDWFFKGQWTSVPQQHSSHERAFAYFSVPAGILNALSKFKEMPEYTKDIRSIDRAKLINVCGNALAYAKGEYTGVVPEKTLEQLEQSYRSVMRELGPNGNRAGDLYFLKTCMVAAHMSQDYNSDAVESMWAEVAPKGPNEYIGYNFNDSHSTRTDTIHYPTERIAFALAVVDYLKAIKK